ncbi:3-oxo-5-alpha-steroid 4-dehydrogenase-domain-containing protein [Syncephalis plumigaleata]|nr:3-oxo-5-alpha-steroid 4-dehydrogenase-domain-containing protein [Syncephalis plumigaleata]
MSVAVILTTSTATLQRLFLFYGKVRTTATSSASASSASSASSDSWMQYVNLTISKRRFRDFYLLGALWNAYLLVDTTIMPLYNPFRSAMTIHSKRTIIVAYLMQIQLLRRYYECLFVERPSSNARMHIGHYVVGMSYYLVTCLAIWCHDNADSSIHSMTGNSSSSLSSLYALLALALFVYASYQQYHCHCILAQLRVTQPDTYTIPYGGWFNLVSSPHYLAEFLIYLALTMLLHFPRVCCCLLVWVVINLGTTARQSHQWYRRHFRNYPANRTAFIPILY